jgi:hypothetical protein
VGTEGFVHAFEPAARNCQRLSKTIELNQPPNLRAHKIALERILAEISIIGGPTGSWSKTHLGDRDNEASEIMEQITWDTFRMSLKLTSKVARNAF